MRRLSLLAGATILAGAAGCGHSAQLAGTRPLPGTGIDTSLPPTAERGTITTSAIPRGQLLRGDGDADNPGDIDGNGDIDPEDSDSDYPVPNSYRLPDEDDRVIFAYGHSPSPTQRRAIATVVERYYAAAGAADGVAGCALLTPSLARSVYEDYGKQGPAYLRVGTTCEAVLSALFRHRHDELAEAITVVAVGVEGPQAQAVFSSRSMPASRLFLRRQSGRWGIVALTGQPLA